MEVSHETERADAFSAWRDQVEQRLVETLGRGATAIEAEVGPLPFELGWESGDSAQEFVAGAVLPLLAPSEAR
jgi:hypothetical protein